MQDSTAPAPPPAGPTLRPLGIGDIVDRAINLYRAAPKLLFAVAALPYLVLTVIQLSLLLTFPSLTAFTQVDFSRFTPAAATPFSFTPAELGTLAVYAIVVSIASLIVTSVQTAALVDAVAKRYLGRATAIGSSLRAGLRASGRLILTGIVAFVLVALAFALAVVALVVAGAVIRNAAVNVVLGIGGGIAIFVAIFYVTASLMPLPVVVTLEGAGPLRAIRRSWSLADGGRWRILGLLLLMTILSSIISLLFTLVLLSTIATQGAVRTILQQLVNLFVDAVWAPIQWGAFTLLYYDLRVRKEAFDLQLAAEALPRAT